MKNWLRISLSVVWVCFLTACATTQPDHARDEGMMQKEVPLAIPVAVQVEKPRGTNVGPVSSKIPKAWSPAEPLEIEPAEVEPDPARNVFFSLGSAAISEDARSTLIKIAELLKEDHLKTITLVGSTDDLGSREYCVAISSKRTDGVESELLKLGVHQNQIHKRPRGNEAVSRKICNSEACRHDRRRVEIQFVE